MVTVLALTMGVLAIPLAACGGLSFTTARLSEATMAASVDETTHQPIDKTDTFSADTPVIFASAKLSNAPPGTEVTADWIYVSGEVADLENYTIMTLADKYDGTQYLYFSVTKTEAGWPAGDYKVVLSIDGKEQASIPFTVIPEASATTIPPKPENLLASDAEYQALLETFDSWGLDFYSLFTTYAQQDLDKGWNTMWLGSVEDEAQRVRFTRVGDSWKPAPKPENLLASEAEYQELCATFDSWGMDFYSLFTTYSQQAIANGWDTMWLGSDVDEAHRVSFSRVGDNWKPDDAIDTETGVATFQEIRVVMPKRDLSSVSVTFTNTLSKGDVIQGFIEISGELKTQDWSFQWTAEVVNPEGETIDLFRGHWVKDNHYDLDVTVKEDGEYKIVVRHNSRYEKNILVNIRPEGWSY